MALAMNTARSHALQNLIQKELAFKGYSAENDPVMAEYITIMLINNKTSDQITSELIDLVGSEYDPKFTDWLFQEAKSLPEEEEEEVATDVQASVPGEEDAPAPSTSRQGRAPPSGPRSSFQQAIQTISPPKRPLSPSASPFQPANKKGRLSDLPDRPRAMRDDNGGTSAAPHSAPSRPISQPRSLLERVGPAPGFHGANRRQDTYDPVQAQIDAVTSAAMNNGGGAGYMQQQPQQNMDGMGVGAFQEMMAAQMALMAQMAMTMGIPPAGLANPAMQQFNNGGFQQGNNFQGPGHMNGNNGPGMRRGRGGARGRGGPPHLNGNREFDGAVLHAPDQFSGPSSAPPPPPTNNSAAIPIVAPKPISHNTPAAPSNPNYPTRPATPSLCKFSLKCTNPVCRYSHPSPSATPESGLVLSNESCEKGIKCEDQDCTKGHPSPAILNPNAVAPHTAPPSYKPSPTHHKPGFKAAYTPYSSKPTPGGASTTPCRFGSGCTRSDCTFQHPQGRTLPGSFHRGISATDPTVTLSLAQEKAKMASARAAANANRFNKTMTFNTPKPAASATTTAAPVDSKVEEVEKKVENGGDIAKEPVASTPALTA